MNAASSNPASMNPASTRQALGRPVADLDDFLEITPEIGLRTAPDPGPPPARRRPRALWWLLAAALLVVSAIGYTALRESPTAAAATDAPMQTPTVPAGVPGFAEMYVAAYLTGTSDAIGEFLPAAPSVAAMTPGARYVTRTATAELTRVADDYWRVVVAADVLVLENGTYSAAGLQYFQVGIVDDGGRLVAAALPARVAGPAPRPTPPRSLQIADGTPTDEQAALAGDFLEALLTDRRDIERYVAPGTAIAAISPAAYKAISITALGLYGDGSALATVDAQRADGTIDSMHYVIGFSDESSQSSVAALLAGPPSIKRTDG